METAAALIGKAASVTIIDLVEAPFQLALGSQVGNAVKKVRMLTLILLYFQFASCFQRGFKLFVCALKLVFYMMVLVVNVDQEND